MGGDLRVALSQAIPSRVQQVRGRKPPPRQASAPDDFWRKFRRLVRHGKRYLLADPGESLTARDASGEHPGRAVSGIGWLRNRRRQSDVARGEFTPDSRVRFADYAREWAERYQGTGRRGFREQTRDEYRRLLAMYAVRYFPARLRLADITPRHVAQFVGWLCDESAQGRALSDSTVRNILSPVRACLATAQREGLIRHNPTTGVALPHRPRVEDHDDEPVRVLTHEQLAVLLAVAPARYRALFTLLAVTGLRVSEALALQWRHLQLDGERPCVHVRRAYVRGRYGPPKSRHGRRDVPLPFDVVRMLRAHHAVTEWPRGDDLVFPSEAGTPLMYGNVLRRALKPAAEEAGVPWAGFHTLRHTCASLLFAAGRNAVQVQRWLGHHSAAFTLERYVHLLPDDLSDPLDLAVEVPTRARSTAVARTRRGAPHASWRHASG
jgi:integrase